MTETTIFEGLEEIFRAGASKAREWPFNADAQVMGAVYEAMAVEAAYQVRILNSRHD